MTEIIDRFEGRYRFLSNFYGSNVRYQGHWWPTVEHAYQGAKCPRGWETARLQILQARTPGVAKRLGRDVPLRRHWDTMKFLVMYQLLSLKFTSTSDLWKQLQATGDAQLVEGNTWHDQIWGDCICHGHGCLDPGENWLGHLLMVVRDSGAIS